MSDNASASQGFRWSFLAPWYWGIWLGVGILLPLAWLPWSVQYRLGSSLGNLMWLAGRKRRRETLVNIHLCFPELTPSRKKQLARDAYRDAGVGVFESLTAWTRPHKFERRVTISGLHHVVEAQQAGRSIIMLGAHYSVLDLGGLLGTRFVSPVAIVYRPQNNPLLEWLIHSFRARIYPRQIDHADIRGIVRALKDKCVLWYTPDQDFGLKQGVMAPFFGQPAATLTAQRRLAKIDHSTVMAIHFKRTDDRKPFYHITITPPLEDYPSADEVHDATRVNSLLESLIRLAPSQYMWFHRRFKTRLPGMPDVYGQLPDELK